MNFACAFPPRLAGAAATRARSPRPVRSTDGCGISLRVVGNRRDERTASRVRAAFTIIEIMLAIAIFSMVITAIYSSWSAILRAARVGGDAAADIQRSRIASRTVEDALVCAVMYTANGRLYSFDADTSGDFAAISFVSRLPPSFPGAGYFGDQVVRRVTFTVERANDGFNQLVLTQIPILQTNVNNEKDYSIVLAREVSMFALDFWDTRANDWVSDWLLTNQLPKQVRFTLGFGQGGRQGRPKDLTTRTVSLASAAVLQIGQIPRAAPPPGAPPGGPVPPGTPGAPGVQPVPGTGFQPGFGQPRR